MNGDGKQRRTLGSIVPQIVAIAMLGWALIPANPYGYYIILRFVVCGVCAYLAVRAFQIDKIGWVLIVGITAVIYNPIIRVHLAREIWSVVNIATIIMLIVTIQTLRTPSEGSP